MPRKLQNYQKLEVVRWGAATVAQNADWLSSDLTNNDKNVRRYTIMYSAPAAIDPVALISDGTTEKTVKLNGGTQLAADIQTIDELLIPSGWTLQLQHTTAVTTTNPAVVIVSSDALSV